VGLRRLIEGRTAAGLPADPWTVAKHQVLTVEHARVSARREKLNGAVARAAASFMVDHARAAGASVIYLEDLREMEARHLAARHGIAVVTVPPRGTSKYCLRCLTSR
jgi:transposase